MDNENERFPVIELSAGLCRMARSALNWSQGDLAENSGVTKRTIADFEREARTPFAGTLEKLFAAFVAAGTLFLETPDAVYCGLPTKPKS
jgi:transcriptional regulator with XRE-family HTH domain